MKKVLFAVLVVLIAGLIGAGIAFADAEVEGMFNWIDPCGYTCYQWADGSGDCYPCLQCEECNECEIPPPPPIPDPDPDPDPVDKEKCNSGRGNDSEGDPDCDPGNSEGKNKGGD